MSLSRARSMHQQPVTLMEEVEPTVLSRGYVVFLRCLAIVFVYFTLRLWLEAVGFFDPALRFDKVDTPMRIYFAVLGVLFPISAVGLWTTLSWGRVVWLLAIGFQMIAGWLYPHLFARAGEMTFFHLSMLTVYLGFTLGVRITAKKA